MNLNNYNSISDDDLKVFFDKVNRTIEKFMLTFEGVCNESAKAADVISSIFGFKAYARAGYPYRKTIRGYKKWRKQKFDGKN